MGITGLAPLIGQIAPEAIKETDMKSYSGKRIAIDASISLCQFKTAMPHLTNDSGENTSHISGFFYRTVKLLEAGIKPVYVFDGKPPKLKAGTLEQRKKTRGETSKKLEECEKFGKRSVRVKKLLKLMGLPVVEAPSEAEAQCAQMCKDKLVCAVATEDMDALVFGAPKLIRHLGSGSKKVFEEFELKKCLDGLELSMEQFIDLCILMGCDYCPSINGIGMKKGLGLIRKESSIEKILINKYGITEFVEEDDQIKGPEKKVSQSSIDSGLPEDPNEDGDGSQQVAGENATQNKRGKKKEKKDPKVNVPVNWQFKAARQLFLVPNVLKDSITESDLQMKNVDEEGIVAFLCGELDFNEERVQKALKRIKDSRTKASKIRKIPTSKTLNDYFKTTRDMVPKCIPDKKKVQPNLTKASSVKPTKNVTSSSSKAVQLTLDNFFVRKPDLTSKSSLDSDDIQLIASSSKQN